MNSHQVANFLNQLIELDRGAVEELFASRVRCNQPLANHPTVQTLGKDGLFWVGILGILNGIYGCNPEGTGYIEAHFDGQDRLVRFVSVEPT